MSDIPCEQGNVDENHPLISAYNNRIDHDHLLSDRVQSKIVDLLADLSTQLCSQEQEQSQNWFAKYFMRQGKLAAYIKGLYIWGGVGRGKTMLMDLFYEQVPIERKKRIHFHHFMQTVHEDLFKIRKENEEINALDKVIENISEETKLLCLDEFMVTDITDAMIMARLFKGLFENNMILVTTSNTPPENLYENGFQRARFLPFIDILQKYVNVTCLDSEKDYRLNQLGQGGIYFSPNNEENKKRFLTRWEVLKSSEEEVEISLQLNGRVWNLPRCVPTSYGCASLIDFDDACRKPRGIPDYHALSKTCPIIFLDNIPIFEKHERNEVRRFIRLIDTLYDNKNAIVICADAVPQNLYQAGEHAVEFERTASRLIEMQSEDYFQTVVRDTHTFA